MILNWHVHPSFNPVRAFALAIVVFVLSGLSALAAGERVALVLGNANYEHVGALRNPLNDAADVTEALRALDFEVLVATDATRKETLALIKRFGDLAAASEMALFYYAGHAFQVDGSNFLLPVDLRPETPEDALEKSVALDAVMTTLKRAPRSFVFLDACRDNPLGLTDAGRGSEGLAEVSTPGDYMIVFATEPGKVAFDGDGRNGVFTEALLNHLQTPGQTVDEMMISVTRDVKRTTGNQQVPYRVSTLTEVVRLGDGTRKASNEATLFQIASLTQDERMMSYYVERYPQGSHVSDATEFLLGESRSTQEISGGESDDHAEQLWDLAWRTRQRPLAQFYLDLFPRGANAADAEHMLRTLPASQELGAGQKCERLATHPKDATAANAGVPFAKLQANANQAVLACQNAVKAFPEQPRYKALLARATFAAGQGARAIRLYHSAAEAGDVRAMVSLGLLHELGNGVEKSPQLAISYYERAAAADSAEGMINLAVALFQGELVPQDTERALALFRRASSIGAAEATFNLGVLAQRGLTGAIEDAYGHFLQAAQEGEPRGYRAAAILADRGFGVQKDFAKAASLLLRGAAEDRGEVVKGFRAGDFEWSPQTLRAVQTRLADAGYYRGGIDGIAGPELVRAIEIWRRGGFDESVLDG